MVGNVPDTSASTAFAPTIGSGGGLAARLGA